MLFRSAHATRRYVGNNLGGRQDGRTEDGLRRQDRQTEDGRQRQRDGRRDGRTEDDDADWTRTSGQTDRRYTLLQMSSET